MCRPIFKLFLLPMIGLFSLRASADTHINSQNLPARVWHKMVMPGTDVHFRLRNDETAFIDGVPTGPNWTVPNRAGNHILKIMTGDREVAHMTLFVLEPSTSIDEKGYLGKYRIGTYPNAVPQGFIKLEQNERNLPVSPHFKVGQFLCKQQASEWPKYLLVSEDNLVRLETLLEDLNAHENIQADTLFVMSGFRTPFYNTAIGSAKFSRHMYGDAADIYVDTKPRDGKMDDLDGDGKVTKADANFLYDYAARLFKERQLKSGGLGAYKANAAHGPFVHVDARGHIARWGR